MADGFGAYVDHFGILAIVLGDGTLADVLEITDDPKTPDAQSRAEAKDKNGDIAKANWHGNTAGELFSASNTFVCKSGTFSLELIKGGEVATGKVITGIETGTSNDGWPTLVVTGKLGTESIVAPTGFLNTWTLPDIDIIGAKRAQLLDFTEGAGCETTASGLSAALDLAQQNDGVGEPVAHGISGGMLTMTATLGYITAAGSWTPGAGWEETQGPGTGGAAASHHSTSVAAEKIWERDAAA